jgi:hypothetical protein
MRVRRSFADRCLSLLVPLVRYRCAAVYCGWEGLGRRGEVDSSRLHRAGGYLPNQVLEPSRSAAPPAGPWNA